MIGSIARAAGTTSSVLASSARNAGTTPTASAGPTSWPAGPPPGASAMLASGRAQPDSSTAWWREPYCWAVLLTVAAIYFSRINEPTLQGEETRRALVAAEMLRTGDWVVPREQGEVFPDRPPLGNWAIAITLKLTGSRDAWAVRLPSVLATLLTTWLVYVYGRGFLSCLGATVAALVYATFGQVLQLGRLAETEALFTLLVAASLLGWHSAWMRNGPHLAAWLVGYGCAALAALAKGPQGPVYFGSAVVGYLLLRREGRQLFSWPHLAGLVLGLAIVAAWTVPYAHAVEWPLVLQTWGALATARFDYSELTDVLAHLASFPIEVFGCLLPWSVFLLAYVLPRPRTTLRGSPAQVQFLLLAIALAFPTCWLAPQARGRYFMPLYPCFCPLIGLAIERAALGANGMWQWVWRHFCTGAALLMGVLGLGVLAASLTGWAIGKEGVAADWAEGASWANDLQSQPVWFAVCYAGLAAGAVLLAWQSRGCAPDRMLRCMFAFAALLGLTYVGVGVNAQVHVQNDVAAQVAWVRRLIPAGERLVSIGKAYHRFVYWYGKPIEVLEPLSAANAQGTWKYFCYHLAGSQAPPELPFGYQVMAVVGCDRCRDEPLYDRVVVARRLDVASGPVAASGGAAGGH